MTGTNTNSFPSYQEFIDEIALTLFKDLILRLDANFNNNVDFQKPLKVVKIALFIRELNYSYNNYHKQINYLREKGALNKYIASILAQSCISPHYPKLAKMIIEEFRKVIESKSIENLGPLEAIMRTIVDEISELFLVSLLSSIFNEKILSPDSNFIFLVVNSECDDLYGDFDDNVLLVMSNRINTLEVEKFKVEKKLISELEIVDNLRCKNKELDKHISQQENQINSLQSKINSLSSNTQAKLTKSKANEDSKTQDQMAGCLAGIVALPIGFIVGIISSNAFVGFIAAFLVLGACLNAFGSKS